MGRIRDWNLNFNPRIEAGALLHRTCARLKLSDYMAFAINISIHVLVSPGHNVLDNAVSR